MVNQRAREELASFAKEALIAEALVNRNVVTTYSHDIRTVTHPGPGVQEHGVYKFHLLQEYCNGGSLSEAVAEGCFSAGALRRRWQSILSLLRDIAEGMDYIHSCRICHGDLSPSHIMLKVRNASDFHHII